MGSKTVFIVLLSYLFFWCNESPNRTPLCYGVHCDDLLILLSHSTTLHMIPTALLCCVWVWQYPVILWANPGLWWESRSCESGICTPGVYVLLSDVMWPCVKRWRRKPPVFGSVPAAPAVKLWFPLWALFWLGDPVLVQQIYKTKNRQKSVNEFQTVQVEPLLLIAHEKSAVK